MIDICENRIMNKVWLNTTESVVVRMAEIMNEAWTDRSFSREPREWFIYSIHKKAIKKHLKTAEDKVC